ncbi:c-type cytochrome [Pedobacter sp.]|uniref:c-type cytochrome n=1 Tax=Pedobacter sp. TaxID=1411316 RepID=UPI00396C388D
MRKYVLAIVFSLLIGSSILSCQDEGQIEQAKYLTGGKDLYKLHCQNCHGENGEGLGELAPPLTDSVFLADHKQKLACYIKNGLSDTITVNGIKYDSKMPGFKQLNDIDIAKLIVYITNSFGHKQGMYKYEQVAADLQNCK